MSASSWDFFVLCFSFHHTHTDTRSSSTHSDQFSFSILITLKNRAENYLLAPVQLFVQREHSNIFKTLREKHTEKERGRPRGHVNIRLNFDKSFHRFLAFSYEFSFRSKFIHSSFSFDFFSKFLDFLTAQIHEAQTEWYAKARMVEIEYKQNKNAVRFCILFLPLAPDVFLCCM